MSNHHTPEYDRHGNWRRWHMDDLSASEPTGKDSGTAPLSAHQRKVAAAQRAAEDAREREEQAKQEAYERIRQQAEEEGYQAGLARGHEEGFNKGLAEGRDQAETELAEHIHKAVTPLESLARQFADAVEHLDEAVAHDLVELAMATGKQLAADALDEHPEQILTIVRELMHTEPPLVGQQRLWLNPEDHALVKEHLGSELSAAHWVLQPDDQLARGGCRITSAQGELDATFETRWQSISTQLRKRHQDSSAASAP